jgi:hypothetical protein
VKAVDWLKVGIASAPMGGQDRARFNELCSSRVIRAPPQTAWWDFELDGRRAGIQNNLDMPLMRWLGGKLAARTRKVRGDCIVRADGAAACRLSGHLRDAVHTITSQTVVRRYLRNWNTGESHHIHPIACSTKATRLPQQQGYATVINAECNRSLCHSDQGQRVGGDIR